MKRFLKRLIAAPFVFLAAIIILVEDWLWDDLQRFAAFIGRLPVLRQLESFITTLPPYGALLFFATPSLLLIPVKLAAVYFLSHGLATLGLLVAIGAKVVGTALVARIFTLTKPNLMRINWFARCYGKFTAFKAYVYGRIKATAMYRLTHRWKLRLRERVVTLLRKRKSVWKTRWEAAIRLMRRSKSS